MNFKKLTMIATALLAITQSTAPMMQTQDVPLYGADKIYNTIKATIASISLISSIPWLYKKLTKKKLIFQEVYMNSFDETMVIFFKNDRMLNSQNPLEDTDLFNTELTYYYNLFMNKLTRQISSPLSQENLYKIYIDFRNAFKKQYYLKYRSTISLTSFNPEQSPESRTTKVTFSKDLDQTRILSNKKRKIYEI